MDIPTQIYWIIILSMVIGSITWTVTQEEIFAEPREWCGKMSKEADSIFVRKFFYVWTCEYCFSHWVTFAILLITGFRILIDDWRGFFLAFFLLPWISNQWMSIYRRLRVAIKHENALAEKVEIEDAMDEEEKIPH